MVLYLASRSGVGVTSAAAVASRLCLTVNGLLINPLSSMAMVHLGRQASGKVKEFALILVAVFLVLATVALVLIGARPVLMHLIGNRGRFSASNAATLFPLIPAYSAWMIALGFNLMLARLSFAMGRARLFTVPTLIGYVIANSARVFIWLPHHDFGLAIMSGAFVELSIAAMVAISVVLLGRADRPAIPEVVGTLSTPAAMDTHIAS